MLSLTCLKHTGNGNAVMMSLFGNVKKMQMSLQYMNSEINEITPPSILQIARFQVGIERVKTEHGMAAWGLFLKSYEWYPYTDDSHTRFPYKDEKRYS